MTPSLTTCVLSQVTEREKWQRYCWELEERLHDAVHTSNAKEVHASVSAADKWYVVN